MNIFIDNGKLHYRVNDSSVIIVCDIVHTGKEYKLGYIDGKACGLYFGCLEHIDTYFNRYHANSCLRKVKYVSRRKAKEQLKTHDDKMNVYHCIFCNGYHIGHCKLDPIYKEKLCQEKQVAVMDDKFSERNQLILNNVMDRINIIKCNKVIKFLNYDNLIKIDLIDFSYDPDEFIKQMYSLKKVIRSRVAMKLSSHKICLSDVDLDLLINFEYELFRLKYLSGHEGLVSMVYSWGGLLV